MDANETVARVIGIVSAALIYFVPAIIAKRRHIENLEAIFLVNLVFGWTILGWIGALIWSIIEKQKGQGVHRLTVCPNRGCPQSPAARQALGD